MTTSLRAKIGLEVVVVALALLWAGSAAGAPANRAGYLKDSGGHLVRNDYGECWRMGYWTPAMAIPECEPMPEAVADVIEAMPPRLAPATLRSQARFAFDRAVVRPEDAERLRDELVTQFGRYPEVSAVRVTGHADRIGPPAYNQALSERRATAVASYLEGQGVEPQRITTEGRGESEPLVSCSEVRGRENRYNRALVECLQPNRRAEVEVDVMRPAE